jgi:hypothetical protein
LRELHERSRGCAPRQLPASAAHFVGRRAELARLAGAATDGVAGVIIAIDGPAGVGKTALAVRWAHTIADRFPDGLLHADLRGFDLPADPADVLAGFLAAFGVAGDRAAADLPGLYRSVVADRRVLVLLDNARDVEQVRPLLPAGRGCLAVITSRNRLTGLVVREGAVPVTLGALAEPDAVALLAAHLGEDRVAAEPDAAADLVAFCGGSPLTLTAAAAAGERAPTLRALVDELAEVSVKTQPNPRADVTLG